MINFAQFVNQAMPEVERVATEMAHYYGSQKHPTNEYFHCEVVSYYQNGKIYERSNHSTWAGDMQYVINDGKRNKWEITYNPENKVFKLEKHFPNGMYRIATYTPYDSSSLNMTVHE